MKIYGLLIAGSLLISGIIYHYRSYILIKKVRELTAGDPNQITKSEAWLSTRSFKRNIKLKTIIEETSNQQLKSHAENALNYESRATLLWFAGIISFIIGVNL